MGRSSTRRTPRGGSSVDANQHATPDRPPADGGADRKGLTRKTFVGGVAAAGAAIGLGGAGTALGGARAPATPKSHARAQREALVLVKGKIHTIDGSSRVVEGV